jgi:catecholate siderophore receptor
MPLMNTRSISPSGPFGKVTRALVATPRRIPFRPFGGSRLPVNGRLGRAALLAAGCALAANLARSEDADAGGEIVYLEKFEVTDHRVESVNYQARQSGTATKTDTPLSDIPQSISVVTEQQIRDQQMLSLGDVARYVPGLGVHQGENNRDQLVFRGTSTSADFFLDGVRDDVQYYRDVYNLSRIEVLMGPDAMIFGRGGGGGLINRVTKQAGFSPERELTLAAGSAGSHRVTLDVDQPLSTRVAGRVNGLYEASDSFRHGVALERYAVNPTLTILPDLQTRIALDFEFSHDRRTADRGITSFRGRPADVPISTYYGDPQNSHVSADVSFLSAEFQRQIGNLTLRNHTTYGDYDRGYQNFVPGAVDSTGTRVTLTAYNNATKRQNLFNQTDLVYAVETGPLQHTLLAGAELGLQHTENFRNTGYFNNVATALTVPFANPTITTPVTFRQSATDADNHLVTDLAAAFVQDQVKLTEKLQAIAGLRFDSFDLKYRNNRTGDNLERVDHLASPRAGLIYKPVAPLSLYGSYSVSYLPSSGDQFSSLTTITQQVKPEKFTNHEVGAKWALTPGFTLNSALYVLDRTNTRSTDPADPTRIVQTGGTRTRGVEIGFSGNLTRAWVVSGGYADQDATIRSATTAAPAGAQIALVPHHNFTLWNKYQVAAKLGLGLGAIYRSDMFAAIDNSLVLPGYTRVDAALYYTLGERWHLQANVENLLDRKYYANADSNTNISPGSPLAVRVLLRTSF